MKIEHFFDEPTFTLSYLVHDGRSGVVIDPVRNYDPRAGRTSWASSEAMARSIDRQGLEIPYAIDTHVHADHMSGLPFFKQRYGAKSVVGARIGEIQQTFRDFYHLEHSFSVDGSQFDVLIEPGDRLRSGSLEAEALCTPGHTPSHLSWRIGDAVFLGDTLFMPDYGAARCDFPKGSAAELYDSVQRLYALPDATRLFVCHDYLPGGRPLAFQTSVLEQKRKNVQLNQETSREEFVAFRQKRDAELAAPNLILPSIQVNIRAGALPEPEENGTSYLKIPLNSLGGDS